MTASGFRFGLPDVNDGRPWSKLDERHLEAAINQGNTLEEAAKRLNRWGTADAVATKAITLGLKWTPRESQRSPLASPELL